MRVLIWDLPTRIFHWSFAGGTLAAFVIAKVGEHSSMFPYHAIIGLIVGCAIVLRVGWGLIGSRHARLSRLIHSPASVIAYFRGIIEGSKLRHSGHNPASSYAIIAMIVLAMATILSGIGMSNGFRQVKEVHEVASTVLIIVAGIHVCGVIVHTVRFRDNISAGMLHGKVEADPAQAIASARPVAALFGVAMLALIGITLIRGFDSAKNTVRVPFTSTSISIGEGDSERGGHGRGHVEDD